MTSAESGLKCIPYIFGFKDIYGYNLTGVTGLSDVIEPTLLVKKCYLKAYMWGEETVLLHFLYQNENWDILP